MRTIWKYPLNPDRDGRVLLDLPLRHEPLAVGHQGGQVVAWFAVDPERGFGLRTFEVAGTGWERPSGEHLGTVQTPEGLVWHVFELPASDDEGGGHRDD